MKITPAVYPPQQSDSQQNLPEDKVSVTQFVEFAEPSEELPMASLEETAVVALKFNKFDINILKEYLGLLTKDINVEAVGILNVLSDKSKSNTDANLGFDRLFQLISPIEGGARFFGAKLTETLVRLLNQMNMKLSRITNISKDVMDRSTNFKQVYSELLDSHLSGGY